VQLVIIFEGREAAPSWI